jgi:hypothetical protein
VFPCASAFRHSRHARRYAASLRPSIRQAAAEAKLKAAAEAQERRDAEGRRKGGRNAAPPSTEPYAKAQKNFIDPESRIMKGWSTSCWWRAPCCTPRPNGTGVLFHSAGPGARHLGVTRNPWNLRITWANWPHPIRAPPDQPND